MRDQMSKAWFFAGAAEHFKRRFGVGLKGRSRAACFEVFERKRNGELPKMREA
jgi:hypothetical protein